MPEIPEGHARLAGAMDERRLELGLRWADLTARGGPSGEWIRALRRGEAGEIRGLTRARIARALGWERGHVDELLGEGDATGMEPGLEPRDDYEREVAATPGLSDETIAQLFRVHRARVADEPPAAQDIGRPA